MIVRHPADKGAVNIAPDLSQRLAGLLRYPNPAVRCKELKRERHGWKYQGPAPETTWYWFIDELLHPSRHPPEGLGVFQSGLWEVLRACIECRNQSNPWPVVRDVILSRIEDLSGWSHCHQRTMHDQRFIYRKDCKLYFEEDGEEVEIIGAQTALEDRWDYIFNAALDRHRPLYHLFRTCALIWTCDCAENQPELLPQSMQIVLPETGAYTGFQQWYWQVANPGDRRRLEWHPKLAHCDPLWLGNDFLAALSEAEDYPDIEVLRPPTTGVTLRAEATMAKYPYQVEFSVDTPIILSDGDVHLFDWRGTPVRWINQTDQRFASLTIPCDEPDDTASGYRVGMEFLASLSFVSNQSARVVTWIGVWPAGGTALAQTKRKPGSVGLSADVSDLAERGGHKRNLGMAFFREGMSSGSVYYSFLSFWKVIQLAFNEDGDAIKRWVEESVRSIQDRNVQLRVKEIMETENGIGTYLWNSCRCAIAHASKNPVVDPDNLEDQYRIQGDLPIASKLARLALDSGLLDEGGE